MNSDHKFLFLMAALLMAVLIPLAAGAQERDRKKEVSVKGTVIAENTIQFLPCWHVCGLSLIVRLDKPAPDKFVVVHVEYMDAHDRPRRGLPAQLVNKAGRWKFDATASDGDASVQVLDQYWKVVDEKGKDTTSEMKLPAWSLLDGARNEVLPYGQHLSTYKVEVGKFKRIR